ncbi:hypothetical protein BH10PSE15_BH10PSE15_02760 [soil metagenome]
MAWYHSGKLRTGETNKSVVKLTFARDGKLDDPAKLFYASLDGDVRRAIDLTESATLDGETFKTLVQPAALNRR